MRYSGRQLKEKLYSPAPEENKFVCNICSKTVNQILTNGYSNLCKHSTTHIKNASEEETNNIKRVLDGDQGVLLLKVSVTKQQIKIFDWLRVIVEDLEPFSIVESPALRNIAGRDRTICAETASKYLKAVAQVVEDDIREKLPERFALIFDCWTENSIHFLAVFARFPIANTNSKDVKEKRFGTVLLSFSPYEDETDFSAASLKDEILFVLSRYGKNMNNVVCLVGDNCSVNECLRLVEK